MRMTDGAGLEQVRHYLSEWRERSGLTQDSLAEKIGVNKATISRWESRQRAMDLNDLARVASALGVEPIALLRSPEDHEAVRAIDRFAKLVERVGAERAQKLLDALDGTM